MGKISFDYYFRDKYLDKTLLNVNDATLPL